MAGFSSSTSGQDVIFAGNINLSGSTSDSMVSDGQILIGSTALNAGGTHINVGTITSPNGTVTIGYSSPNITIDLNPSASAIEKINVQAGTTPIVPTSGAITINGNTVIAGTNPVQTVGTAASTFVVRVQISQAIAATDNTKIGLSAFDSAKFTVDANGFTSTSGTGVVSTLTGDSGGAVSPTAGNINLKGTANQITTTGTPGTSTIAWTIPATFIAPGSIKSTTTVEVGSGNLTVDSGNAVLTAGNLTLPNTNAALTQGVISWTGTRIHNFGTDNIFIGGSAGNGTLTGTDNIGIGQSTFASLTSGGTNVALGTSSGTNLTSGGSNLAIGLQSLQNATSANNNTAVGVNALQGLTTTSNNTAIGVNALKNVSTGATNVGIGQGAGTAYGGAESGNIIIGAGVTGTLGESNVTRIGTGQTACYVSGIDAVSVGANAVLVQEASNQLGTTTTTYPRTNAINTLLYASAANVMSALATTNRASLATTSAGVPQWLAMTDGQLVIGSTAGAPAAATLTAGTGITITNASNSITIANTNPSGFPWTDVTGATQTLAVNNGYVTDHVNVTYTLPASASLGDTIKIVGKTGITTIAQNANQQIDFGSSSSTVGVGGSSAGTNAGDCCELICITAGASTVWRAASFVGNWTIT